METYTLTKIDFQHAVMLLFDGTPRESNEGGCLFLEKDRICYAYLVKASGLYYITPLEIFPLHEIANVHINFRCEPYHTSAITDLRGYQKVPLKEYFVQMSYLGIMFELNDRICRFKVRDVRKSFPKLKNYFYEYGILVKSNMNIEKELLLNDEQLYEKYIK